MQLLGNRVAHHILTKPQRSRAHIYAGTTAFTAGACAFTGGVLWFAANVIALRNEYANVLQTSLASWSDFGQAASAPLALASLGAVVISAYYVVKGLHHAESAVKLNYQPLVACSVSLEFDLIGDAKKPHVRVAKPRLNLLLRNLGDSPATFVEIELLKITFHTAMSAPKTLVPTLRQQRALVDHLSTGREAPVCIIPILEPSDADESVRQNEYNSYLAELVSSVLVSSRHSEVATEADDTPTLWRRVRDLLTLQEAGKIARTRQHRLECEVKLAHQNVLALAYEGQGILAWDHRVLRNSPCDPSQIGFIESIEDAIGALERAVDVGSSTKEPSDKIGQYLKRSHSLLGVVQSPSWRSYK